MHNKYCLRNVYITNITFSILSFYMCMQVIYIYNFFKCWPYNKQIFNNISLILLFPNNYFHPHSVQNWIDLIHVCTPDRKRNLHSSAEDIHFQHSENKIKTICNVHLLIMVSLPRICCSLSWDIKRTWTFSRNIFHLPK